MALLLRNSSLKSGRLILLTFNFLSKFGNSCTAAISRYCWGIIILYVILCGKNIWSSAVILSWNELGLDLRLESQSQPIVLLRSLDFHYCCMLCFQKTRVQKKFDVIMLQISVLRCGNGRFCFTFFQLLLVYLF